MSDQYYRFFQGDYLRDTQGLTLTEHGAYRMLLDTYYSQEYLNDDIQELYMICRAFHDFEQKAVEKVASKYFTKNGNGHLSNKRADKEIAYRKAFLAEQSRKGKLSAEKRWPKSNHGSTTVNFRLQPDCNLPSPSPSPIKEKEKKEEKHSVQKFELPDWITAEDWSVFLSHRKTVRAPITKEAYPTFIEKFLRLKTKGYDPHFAIGTMVERGWRWFKPEWIEKDTPGVSRQTARTLKACMDFANEDTNEK